MYEFKGSANIAEVALGYDPMQKLPNGALIKRFAGDSTAKTGVFATYKTGQVEVLTALAAYTVGTTMKSAWFVLKGVDYPQNSMTVDLDGVVPITAVLARGLELACQRLLVADTPGDTPELCIVTAAGNDDNATAGQLAWGTPEAGSFSGAGPTVIAFGVDVHVTAKNVKGTTPWVAFIVH